MRLIFIVPYCWQNVKIFPNYGIALLELFTLQYFIVTVLQEGQEVGNWEADTRVQQKDEASTISYLHTYGTNIVCMYCMYVCVCVYAYIVYVYTCVMCSICCVYTNYMYVVCHAYVCCVYTCMHNIVLCLLKL